jgi:2-polyprenyl-6-methoxyphenol hydroxylase-like FAD-dependent oxidoreductase
MTYDLISVGGGLAGAALAHSLAPRDARCLVLEHETCFRDRVRGEAMTPWGVAEARELGIEDLLLESCAHAVPILKLSAGAPGPPRNLLETTPHRSGFLDFYHPAMQEVMLRAAAEAGAEVRRGVQVEGVTPGPKPCVRVTRNGGAPEEITARLVVGADGRNSKVRRWAGFEVQRDPERLVIGGVLLDGVRTPADEVQIVYQLGAGRGTLIFPQREEGRARAYYVYRKRPGRKPLSGSKQMRDFFDFCVEAGAPAEWYEGAEPAGPLAGYEGADHWVDHPHRDGVVLVGDAAASSDPSWGQGLALTVRDVRVLRDALLSNDDWGVAGDAYADEHDRHYAVIHTIDTWAADLLYEIGPEADALRARALPRILEDPTRLPDVIGLGPAAAADEAARRRFFGED